MIDPAHELCGDRPEDHLTFEWIDNEGYRIAPINSSERGRATIDVMALDRDDLNEMRKKYYARTIQPVIQDFKDAESAQDHKGMAKHQNRARALVAKNAPFSLMASVAFREAGILV